MRSLTIQTNDTIVTSGEELGKISFAASAESDGSTAISVGARVIAQAEGAFQSNTNPTSLVFATAAANAAASGKIKISDNGHFLPMANNTYDIGDSNLRFRNTFAASGYFSNRVATSGSLFFASGNTAPVGAMQWDDGEGTVTLGLKGGNVTASLAQDNVALCYNGTASSLTKGQVVYVSGAQGQRPSVNLALATSDLTSARTFGLVDETITAGAEGFVATFGVVTNLNTASFVAGSALWLSAATPGALTMTRPAAPNHGVFVGWCLNAHASAGRVFVNVQNGHELDELHDVLITSPASGDIIRYDSSAGIWRNTVLPAGGGGSSTTIVNSGDNRVLTSDGSTSGIVAESNLTFNGTKLSVTGDITVDNLTLDLNTIVSSSGNLVIAPAVSGALVASTTGNARGANAVDLQTSRAANTQVSSGACSTVSGGYSNTASCSNSTVSGGRSNTASSNNSTVSGGYNNTASGGCSTVSGGQNNLALSCGSVVSGMNNVAAEKVRRANDITSSTNTITVLNAVAADFDSTTANALQIRYFLNNAWALIARTVSSATQSGNNVNVVVTSNVGAAAQTWSRVTVVNTAETDAMVGQTVFGASNISSGSFSTVSGGGSNTASGYFSTVSGGYSNTASGNCSTVSGGYSNTASGNCSTVSGGYVNTASGGCSTVSGGYRNTASGFYSTVSGGGSNTASSNNSTVSGGGSNTASSDCSTVSGGGFNTASGGCSTVSGGLLNTASSYASTVSGGRSNTASSYYSTVSGGRSNTASGYASTVSGGGYNTASNSYSTVSGGRSNTASGYVSTVSGGQNNLALSCGSVVGGTNNVAAQKVRRANDITSSTNTITVPNAVAADFDSTTANALQIRYFFNNAWTLIARTVSSATQIGNNVNVVVTSNVGAAAQTWSQVTVVNTAETDAVVGQTVFGASNIANGGCSTVSGGHRNTASGDFSTVSGGYRNTASSNNSTVSGGRCNTASAFHSTVSGGYCNTASCSNSTVSGGCCNSASGYASTVSGGRSNTASGCHSTVSGGQNNLALSCGSVVSGTNNVAAQKVRRANDITSSTNTITVLNAVAADFDSITANALQIRYFFNNAWALISRTVSSATQSGNNVNVVVTSNVGAAAQTWSQVTVVNTAETDVVVGQTVFGVSNTASSCYSTVSGGRCNTASSNGSTVSGGYFNTASGGCSTVSGGRCNTASSNNSTVSGGHSNAASGNCSTVSGGGFNTASGNCSTVSGGCLNTASNNYSTVSGGSLNTASSNNSTVSGGYRNTASGSYSTVSGGVQGKATRHGEISHAAGRFAADGDAQHTILIARRNTTDATANVLLFLNGSNARLTIPASTAWTFSIKLSAYNNTDNQAAWWIFRGGIRRNADNGTALVGSLIVENDSESTLSTASATVVADDTNEALEIRVTGVAAKNIRWVAVVDISQVSWGTP